MQLTGYMAVHIDGNSNEWTVTMVLVVTFLVFSIRTIHIE